jgi:DNA invertase Pin-like site-specific DNA recombinase
VTAPSKAASVPAGTRYVELIRVSSTGQAERDTPEDQRSALARLAASRGGVLIERIEDGASGLSGAADLNERPDLQRLAQLARASAFDELRVRHLDRLTRHADPRERFAIYGMVQDAGAVIVDASGHVVDPSSEIGEVDWFLQTWASAKERKRIAERTVAARQRLAAEGRPMTTIPYGRRYDHASGTWSTDDQTLRTYRRLFHDVIAGVSLQQIARDLNAEGTPAPKGGLWEASSVRRMIRNPSAVGVMTSYGHAIRIPPVVDEDTQRLAVTAMKRGRTRSGPAAKHNALLRKIATCSECGSTVHVRTPGHGVLYYACARGEKGHAENGCRAWHRVESVDAAFIEALREMLCDPGRVHAFAPTGASVPAPADDVRAAEKDLGELAEREERLVRLVTKGLCAEVTAERQLAEIARLRSAATERRAAAEAREESAARAEEHAGQIASAVELLRREVENATFDRWRALVELLFPRQRGAWVRIGPDGQIDTHGLLRLTGGETVDRNECQSIPMRQPSDWNQNGCARRRTSSARP